MTPLTDLEQQIIDILAEPGVGAAGMPIADLAVRLDLQVLMIYGAVVRLIERKLVTTVAVDDPYSPFMDPPHLGRVRLTRPDDAEWLAVDPYTDKEP